jgi:archaellum component FlaC
MPAKEVKAASGETPESSEDTETFKLQRLAAMQEPKWNEARLDDLNKKVEEGFKKVDQGFKRVDERFKRIDERFERIDERFERVDERFEKVNEEFKAVRAEMKAGFDRMQWTMFGAAVAVIVALIGAPQL